MKKLTLAFVVLFFVLSAIIWKIGASQPFPGLTANFDDFYDCDARYKPCGSMRHYQEEMFPDGQSRMVVTTPIAPGSSPHWSMITKSTNPKFGSYTTDVVPDVGMYFRIPSNRILTPPGYQSKANGICSPGLAYTPDLAVHSFLGHPAVKYDVPKVSTQMLKSTIFLTDAVCFPAVQIFGFGKPKPGKRNGATYQIASSVTIGTPSIADLQIPAGLKEQSPTDVISAELLLRSQNQIWPTTVPDPQSEVNNMLAGYEGFKLRQKTKLWAATKGQ